MVPVQVSALKQDIRNNGEDSQRDTLLNHLQLDQIERSAIAFKTDTVCRHLTTVLKEGYHP